MRTNEFESFRNLSMIKEDIVPGSLVVAIKAGCREARSMPVIVVGLMAGQAGLRFNRHNSLLQRERRKLVTRFTGHGLVDAEQFESDIPMRLLEWHINEGGA